MKKLFTLAALACCFGLTACGQGQSGDNNQAADQNASQPAAAPSQDQNAAPAAAASSQDQNAASQPSAENDVAPADEQNTTADNTDAAPADQNQQTQQQ